MNVDKNCPKCSNRMGIRCSKCYECGYDYFDGFDEAKPLIIHDVVFNEADYLYQTCQKGKEIMCRCKNKQECKEHSEVEYCLCISRTGIDGDEFGKWTCSSCKKEVFNKHRKY